MNAFRNINLLVFLCIFLTIPFIKVEAKEDAKANWNKNVKSLLPSSVAKIKLNHTTLKEMDKLLGKAALIENNKHYFEWNHFKYALEIIYKNNTATEISFTFNSNPPAFKKVSLPKKLLTPYSLAGSDMGRFLKYTDEFGEIIIDPIDKTIFSIRLK